MIFVKGHYGMSDPVFIRDAFNQALEADEASRETILGRLPEQDRLEVESLLDAHRSAGSFLTDRAGGAELFTGERIGPYRLVELIGHGGMGLVYHAERDDGEFQRTVAIKLVGGSVFAPEAERRFIAERRILGLLDHPHIVRMIDGGIWRGQRYLVMEFVSGEPIDEFCRERGLSLGQRLSLFLQLCSAIAYAHARLVVHRDLKPANILVTQDSQVKVLDFGIARLPTPEDAGSVTAIPPLTLAWASPEQVLGGVITTAADVYGLGVLLFSLLADRLPYGEETVATADLIEAICEKGPVWTPPGLIRSDLRTILDQALQKEPNRRYSSVEQFAADIERYVQGRPVAARPAGLLYRTKKFLTRRAVPLTATAAVAIALAAATLTAIQKGRQAQRRFEQVRGLAHYLIFDVYDSMRRLPGSLAARRQVADRAREYLERSSSGVENDSVLAQEVAEAYLRLGDVLGGPYMANLGDTAGALQSYRQAAGLLERLPARAHSDVIDRRLAEAHLNVGRILVRQIQPDAAAEEIDRGMAIAENLCRRNPTDAADAEMLARAYMYIGEKQHLVAYRHNSAPGFEVALATYGKAVQIQEATADPKSAIWTATLGNKYFHVAYPLLSLGELTRDRSSYCQALAAEEKGARLHEVLKTAALPWNTDRVLTDDLSTIAYAQWKCYGDLNPALKDAQAALARFEILAQADTGNWEALRDFADANSNVGRILEEAGHRSEAHKYYQRALAVYQEIRSLDPNSTNSVVWDENRISVLNNRNLRRSN
jgi:eukaryotic-like serine/threonine-protein kinase